MSANRLMEMMVKKKKSMAVVVDEFGGTSGIVTHEDILEEIVGEIEDEHDNSRLIARQVSENTYVISGRMEIDAINQMFNLSLPENEEYVTIAGLVLHEYEDFPKTNEVVKFGNFKVKILKETDNKIELVKLFVEDKED
jgi:CBS domain containing-hemolysin-like protein